MKFMSFNNSLYKTAKKYSNYTFDIIFGVICAVSSIFLIAFGIPIFLFRAVLAVVAKHVRPDLGKMLNPISTTLVSDLCASGKPPRTNLVIPVTLEGRLPPADFEKLVLQKWVLQRGTDGELKYPQFSQFPVQWLGFMFWKTDANFDIKNHFHTHQNPNGDGETTDKELNELVETLLNARHHPTRSPWEFHILQNFRNSKLLHDGEEMTVVLLKVHHSLGDGFSLLHAFAEDLAGQSKFQLPKLRTPKKSTWERLAYCLAAPLHGAIELARVLKSAFIDSPWKIPDEEKEWHQLYSKSDFIPIEYIKHIKNTLGVSFTSVILSAISSGIHKNLKEKRLNGTIRVKREVNKMPCMSVLPLPAKEGMDKLTNNATGALFNIPAGSFRTSLERLYECDRVLETTKNSILPPMLTWYITCAGSYFRWMCRPISMNRMIPTGLTNFPCFGEDFFGRVLGLKPIFNEFAAGGLEGVSGVAFMVASCRGLIRVAVTAEKGLLSRAEVDALVKCVEDEIHRLYSLSNSNDQALKSENK